MIQPPDFRFTLICLGKEWVLPQAPKGWEESQLNWARSLDYFGVVTSYSVPLQFTLDGAWLLRRIYYSEGVEGKCQLKIEILDRSNWLDKPNQYKPLYIGDIDFSKFNDGDGYVEVNLRDGGVTASVLAYDNVKYEIDISEAIDVRLPGIDTVEAVDGGISALNSATEFYYPAWDMNEPNELVSEYVIAQDQPFNSSNLAPDTNGWFIKGNTPLTPTRIQGSVTYKVLNIGTYYYQVQLVNESLDLVSVLIDTRGKPRGEPEIEYTDNFDVTVDVALNEKLYILVRRIGSGSASTWPFFYTVFGSLTVEYGITTEPSIIKALRPTDLFSKIIDKMGGSGPIASNLLSTWGNLVITCGDAIRGLPEAKIKTSFKDFFKSIDAVLNAGFGVENGVARIEARHYWFRELQILDLGEVKDVNIGPAEEYIFNSIKAGYPDDDYEVDRGREEYNSEQIWSTAITRIQKQIDISSIYRADQYGMEQVRLAQLNADNLNKVDKPQDNDVFFVHIQKEPGGDGVYDVIGEEAYSNISGISTRSSSYNMDITPKKNLLRHGNILRSVLPDSSVITFASSTKNAEFSTSDLSGRTVKENNDITVSTLDSALFHPIAITLTAKLPSRVQDIMETRAFGYMKFTYRDHPFYGYILEASQDVARNSEREFKLLLTRHSALRKFVI